MAEANRLVGPDGTPLAAPNPLPRQPVAAAGPQLVAEVEGKDGEKKETPYFAIEVKRFEDSLGHWIIQHAVAFGTPPPDFIQFLGIGKYSFPIPRTENKERNEPPRMHDYDHPFPIEANNIQEAFSKFGALEHAHTEKAYEAFKAYAQAKLQEQLARYQAQQAAEQAQQVAQLRAHKSRTATAEAKPNGKKNGRR